MTLKHLNMIRMEHMHLFTPGFCFISEPGKSKRYFKIKEFFHDEKILVEAISVDDNSPIGYETTITSGVIIGYYLYESNESDDDKMLNNLL